MNRAVFFLVALLANFAFAAEKKTYSFTCRNGNFSIAAAVESVAGVERWSKNEPVVLQIGSEPPQSLDVDPDAPDADSYKNKDYEFYKLQKFITLIHKSHGVVVKFYDACRMN